MVTAKIKRPSWKSKKAGTTHWGQLRKWPHLVETAEARTKGNYLKWWKWVGLPSIQNSVSYPTIQKGGWKIDSLLPADLAPETCCFASNRHLVMMRNPSVTTQERWGSLASALGRPRMPLNIVHMTAFHANIATALGWRTPGLQESSQNRQRWETMEIPLYIARFMLE